MMALTSTAAKVEKKSFLQTTFEEIFSELPSIDFDINWKCGDYMNGACQVKLAPGQVAGSTEPAPGNRRLIMIGTRVGTAVIFERYTPGIEAVFVAVSNSPRELHPFLPSGSLTEDQLIAAICPDHHETNIGSNLEAIFQATKPSPHIS